MSRVCIVVLEEEEDDSPTFISNLPQENASVHPSPSGNVLVRHVVCWHISCYNAVSNTNSYIPKIRMNAYNVEISQGDKIFM